MSEDHKYLSAKEIRDGCIIKNHGENTESRLCVINQEFEQAFDFISQYPRSVTFWGSARFSEDNPFYQQAYRLAKRIVEELQYAIVSGGGPGIMGASNHGAYDGGGESVGLTIQLPHEQNTNTHVKNELSFYYFFSRKVALAYAAEAYLFFPGGFGTLDEFFEILTLVQTKKVPQVPIILVGKEFWEPFTSFIAEKLRDEHKTISSEDTDLYICTDDEDEILEIIKKAPIREKA